VRYGYAFRRIPLTKGQIAIVDPDDYERLSKYKWSASEHGKTWYAVRREYLKDTKKERCIYMHREVIEIPQGMVVDHINRSGVDNRKRNLRAATCSQNNFNKGKRRVKCRSKYMGVSRRKPLEKWRASITVNGKWMHLGYFDSEVEAAKVYDAAAQKYHGEFAALNFEESRKEKVIG
jgi:hypothetical protein